MINLDTKTIQQLIRYNKVEIRSLDTEKKYLEHLVQLYWNSCNPLDKYSVLSSTAFSCLNKAKVSLNATKKKLKVLAALQWHLKNSLRGGN